MGLEAYPNWFLFPEKFPEYVSGFSYSGNKSEVDAERMYCVYNKVLANGTYYRYNDYDGRVSDYFFDFDSRCLNKVHGNLHQISTFMMNTFTSSEVSLFSLKPIENFEQEIIRIESIKDFDWINNDFWKDKIYFYQVGFYSSKGNDSDAWKTAEEHAMFNLTVNFSSTVGSVSILSQNTDVNKNVVEDLEKVVAIRIDDVIMQDIELLKRYPDNDNQMYYVLIRINKADIYKRNK